MKMGRLTIGLFVLFCSSLAVAHPTNLGMFCWQMAPFVDTIEANVTVTTGAVLSLSFESEWRGLDFYTLEGGGTGVMSPSGNVATLTGTLHNPSEFWGGHPVCRLSMVIMNFDLSGQWGVDCLGTPSEVFRQWGTMEVIACQESTAALIESSRAKMVNEKGGLAGEKSME